MSDEGSGEEDLDKLLNDWDDLPKAEPKPKLAAVSKPRPFQRQTSNLGDESNAEAEVVKAPPVTFDLQPPKSPGKKPSLGFSHVPITSRPKTNPNAALLGNSAPFPPKDDGKAALGIKKPFAKTGGGPSFLKAGKTDSDWLGVGSDSSMPSASATPIVQRKDLKLGGQGVNDPFTFKKQVDPPPLSRLPGPDELKPVKPATAPPVEKSPAFNPDSGLPSFLDKLTNRISEVNDPDKINPLPAEVDSTNAAQRKKVVTGVRKPGSTSSLGQATLQVPSHVIDEDELKRMFLSQKQLYESQVSMVERAYKDQMECVSQSYARKEETLKEELKTMQKDHDDRIGRMKTELTEAELRSVQFRGLNLPGQDCSILLSKVSEQLRDFQLPSNDLPVRTTPGVNDFSTLLDPIEHLLEAKLTSLSKGQATFDPRIVQRLETISTLLENQAKFQPQPVTTSPDQQTEEKITTKVEAIVGKVIKEQKKLREKLIQSAVTTMAVGLESKHENERKKDKISIQIREFRREIQRLFKTFEGKQDSLQRSLDGDQKVLTQNFHDLSTWLRLTSSSSPSTNVAQNQTSVQNEMELKLLKDERNSLSEAIATMNVDRRRLNDERLQAEADRRDLERQRAQIQDLETSLRIKLTDVEETKKLLESSRLEQFKFTSDLSRKMGELESERIRCHDKAQALELTLGLEKRRHDEERAEIMREREFLEKLRLQFLCPNCLRLVRSQGDGHDTITNVRTTADIHNQLRTPANLDLRRKGHEVTNNLDYYGDH